MDDKNTYPVLKSILNKYLPGPGYKYFIFGSRAMSKHRKFSDLDIGILGPSEIPGSILIQIEQDLSDSDIPYLTDVVDLSIVSESFKKKALSNTISI
jgi:predicted nucleotidyltransferase